MKRYTLTSGGFRRFSRRESLPLLRGMVILPGVMKRFSSIEKQGWFRAMRETWQAGKENSLSYPFIHADSGQGQLDYNQ